MRKVLAIFLLSLIYFATHSINAEAQSFADQIGLTALRDRLGAATPDGTGIEIMQAETLFIGGFRPNPGNAQFVGKTFIDQTGGSGFSIHATDVGISLFGTADGVAPGVTRINTYRVDASFDPFDWLGTNYLNFGGGAPVVEAVQRVQNHSWVFDPPFDPQLQEVQRRWDFALRRDNVMGIVGIQNANGGPTPPIPPALSNTYNGLAVGLTNGGASFGPSTGDVVGRSKPDIVGPSDFSSLSTPMVAGSAAVLLQTADGMGNANAGRMETIKATLLSGATKSEFASLPTPWNRFNNGSFVEPLDRRFGAGELNINNSHLILTAGEKNGTDLALDGDRGWDFETMVGQGNTRTYFFDVTTATELEFSATVTWLRRITPTGGGANLFATSDATLSLVELRLFNANPDFSLGTQIDSSISPIDNVQHIYRDDLLTGRYAIQVTLAGLPVGQGDENVAVAWFTTSAVPEPGSLLCVGAGLVGVVGFVRRSRRRRAAMPVETE